MWIWFVVYGIVVYGLWVICDNVIVKLVLVVVVIG